MIYKLSFYLLLAGLGVGLAQADRYENGIRARLLNKDLCGNYFLIPRLFVNAQFTQWPEFPIAYDTLHASRDSSMCPYQWIKGEQAMPVTPTYQRKAGQCMPVQNLLQYEGMQVFYTDAQCSDNRQFQYRGRKNQWPKTDYCRDYVNRLPHMLGLASGNNPAHHKPRLLGNAATWEAELSLPVQPGDALPNTQQASAWELPSGARSFIESGDLSKLHAPFMKRVKYKTVGACQLEMRIFKKDIAATDLQPMLFLHPSASIERGFQFALAQAGVANLTEAGMVVFMPFYRLVGNASTNEACSNVRVGEIHDDAISAFEWVQTYGAAMGARPGKITVGGISAGAGQAMYLAYRAQQNGVPLGNNIDKLALLSPPSSSLDFLQNVQDGGIYANQPVWDTTYLGYSPEIHQRHQLDYRDKIAVVNHYLGFQAVRVSPQLGFPCKRQNQLHFNEPVRALIDLASAPEIEATTFPPMVAASPSTRPPAFILAGSLDKTVPIRQAYLLCDAYGGMGQGEAVVVGERHVKTTYRCGTSSHFHKLEGAGHLFTQRCDHLSKVLTSCNGRVDPARNAAIQSSRQELLDWLLGRI